MSKYEWERGSLVIPTAAWSTFRRDLITKWNEDQERLFTLAVKMRGEVDAAARGKRGFDRAAWLCERLNGRGWGDNGESERANDCNEVTRLIGLRAAYGIAASPLKTRAPRRKDLKILPVSRGAMLDIGEASIALDDDAHTVSWSVSENNHACDTARSLPLARVLFGMLARLTWTRGSGGKIIGNDEYNRSERDDEGAGGNYVTAAFGPLGGK